MGSETVGGSGPTRTDRSKSGPYVDDEQHGRCRIAFPHAEVAYVEFVHGVRQEP